MSESAETEANRPPPKTLGQKIRRVVVITLSVVALLFILALIPITWVASGIPAKSAAAHVDAWPAPFATPVIGIPQTEPHTCGYLALSAVYRAYGLSPEDENLRFRLGVDRTANPFDAESTGTLHPDLLRVLTQDHFSYRFLDPDESEAAQKLCDHLENQQAALLLVRLRTCGKLHWICAAACDNDILHIADSLQTTATQEPAAEFLRDCALSVILLTPLTPASSIPEAFPHQDGMAEISKIRDRIAARNR
ncbi:MAG: hypothetical protein AB7N71_08790 [Phycisphaerae bacterium]